MSLTRFVARPAMRAAFNANAARVRLPFNARGLEPTAPSRGLHHSAVGTAFDYLARFRLAREVMRGLRDADVTLHDTGWAAEDAVAAMADHPRYRRHHPRWSFLVAKARELFDDWVGGREDDVGRVAKCCQYLANVDLLVRIGDFNPFFAPREAVQAELLELDAAFDPLRLLGPRRTVMLNPVFMLSDMVDGADADLIVDDTIIDIKTTNGIGPSAGHLRQLLGYAVLHGMGGVDAGSGEASTDPVRRVGVYFARYGRIAAWDIDEVMPDGGFDRFAAAFRAEIEAERAQSPR